MGSQSFKSIWLDRGFIKIKVKDCLGKSPLDIKKAVVKDLAKKEIEDANILDAYFDVSLENFTHPSWEGKKKVEDKATNDLASKINNINFLK